MARIEGLPQGMWLFLRRLPLDTTAESLANHFCESGLAVPPENVKLDSNGFRHLTAVVSVPREEIIGLVRWALTQSVFMGETLTVDRFGVNTPGRNATY